MTKFVIVLLCLAIVQTSLALKCWNCGDDKKCEKPTEESCKAATGNKEAACLTHIFKDAKDEKQIEKKCVIQDQGGKYECIETPHNKQEECNTCKTDLCNSALRISIPVVLATGLALLVARLA